MGVRRLVLCDNFIECLGFAPGGQSFLSEGPPLRKTGDLCGREGQIATDDRVVVRLLAQALIEFPEQGLLLHAADPRSPETQRAFLTEETEPASVRVAWSRA